MVGVLGRLVDQAKEDLSFEGFKIVRNNVSVSHLQFTNDKEIFLNLLKVLRLFCEVPCLKISMEKGNLLGIHEIDFLSNMARQVGCCFVEQLLKYFGLPLGESFYHMNMSQILEKFLKRNGWNK